MVNRPFWYTEHTVIIGDEWHLTYSNVKGMLGWHTQGYSEQGKMIQKVLHTVESVGGLGASQRLMGVATQLKYSKTQNTGKNIRLD